MMATHRSTDHVGEAQALLSQYEELARVLEGLLAASASQTPELGAPRWEEVLEEKARLMVRLEAVRPGELLMRSQACAAALRAAGMPGTAESLDQAEGAARRRFAELAGLEERALAELTVRVAAMREMLASAGRRLTAGRTYQRQPSEPVAARFLNGAV